MKSFGVILSKRRVVEAIFQSTSKTVSEQLIIILAL